MVKKNDKYLDFDAWLAEKQQKEEPMIVKAFGEEYRLPLELPYDIMLQVARMYKDNKDEMDLEDVETLCKATFGDEVYQDWLRKGIGFEGMQYLIENVMQMYMKKGADESEKQAEAAEKKNPR